MKFLNTFKPFFDTKGRKSIIFKTYETHNQTFNELRSSNKILLEKQ